MAAMPPPQAGTGATAATAARVGGWHLCRCIDGHGHAPRHDRFRPMWRREVQEVLAAPGLRGSDGSRGATVATGGAGAMGLAVGCLI